METSRRRLLQVGAGGALVLALGGVGLALQSTAMRTPQGPLQVLDEREYSILAAIAEAILPPHPQLPSTDEVDVAGLIDALLATKHPGDATEFKQGLMLMENGLPGLLFDGRPRPLSTYPVAERTRQLDHWRKSAIPLRRKVFRAIYGLVGASYWGHPATHAFVGYKGPPDWIVAVRDSEM